MNVRLKLGYFATLVSLLSILTLNIVMADSSSLKMPEPEAYCKWRIENFSISEPLCGLVGDVERGKAIASDGSRGNCLACHELPIDGIEAYGDIGPPLTGIASRLPQGISGYAWLIPDKSIQHRLCPDSTATLTLSIAPQNLI